MIRSKATENWEVYIERKGLIDTHKWEWYTYLKKARESVFI